ncbi:TcfC E-set like domain-containing protein [Aliikangiella coralliicola]|nr:TcfC E-set like domain-containing protein [Aliikangiella coralliicola]
MRSLIAILINLIGLSCASAQQANTSESPEIETQQSQAQQNENQQPQQPVITTTAPEGYDDLLEPQLTLVDIFYNGNFVGSSMASYSPETITFESPQEVVSLLSNIRDSEIVLAGLSLPLATNQSYVCFYQGQPGCGVLTPREVGVIFDESRLRVDIFVNPSLLEKTRLSVDRYLPVSTTGASMINHFSLIASGGEAREEIYTAQLSSIFSYDNYRVLANIESDNQDDTRLDQLSMIYEHRDMAYQVGSFRTMTQSSGFFGQRDFLGFRMQSTLASRTDLEQVSGTSIFVFLNERSRVEVYKDGQLIDSRIYSAGNIELDTRDFPQGAYTVELKIIGASGRERTEEHFYSKSLQLPPTDETLYFVEVGYPEDDKTESYPVAKDDGLARLGFVTRPTEYAGFSGSLVKNPEQESIEIGSYWLGNQIELQTNHAFTGDDEHANYYLLSLRHPDFFLSASYRRTYSEELPGLDDDLRLIAPNSRQTLINLGVPLADSILNVFARTTEQQGQENYRALGVSWRKNIFRSGKLLLDWTVDATKEIDDRRIATGLTLRFLSNRLNVDSSLIYQQQKRAQLSTNHLDKNVRVAYRNPQSSFGSVNHSLELNQTIEQSSATFQSEISNDYGYGRLEIDHTRDETNASLGSAGDASRTGYSLSSQFNFVTSGGEMTVGGNRQNRAGVMIDLKSIKAPGLSFAVIINEVERTRVKAGTSSFVALSPYQSYELVLTPIGETLVQFDNAPRKFTLYPGNVENLSWQIKQVRVIVMQLIDKNDNSFANAKLRDTKNYARTDDLGWVQMEVSGTAELLFIDGEERECRVVIEQSELSETVNFLGVKNCQ